MQLQDLSRLSGIEAADLEKIDIARLSPLEQEKLIELIEEFDENPDLFKQDLMPFDEFCYKYLAHHFEDKIPDFRKDTIEYLNNRSIQNKQFATVEPRGHGKSTTYVLGYSIYQIAMGLRNYIIYFSATKREAESWLNNIRIEIENNDALLADFPFLKKEVSRVTGQATAWNDSNLFFASGQRISAKGWFNNVRGANHYGKRPDFILLDDAENEEYVATAMARDKFLNYYFKVVANLAGAGGCDLFIVGTLLHPESFLARAIDPNGPEEFADFEKRFHKAVINWETREVLWPEMWDFDRLLEKQAQIGEAAFAQEYQGVPMSIFRCIFTESKVLVYSNNIDLNRHAAGWNRYMYVDPSMGKTGTSDYSSLAIAYVKRGGEVTKPIGYVPEWFTARLTPEQLCQKILDFYNEHQFIGIGFETNSAQGLFINLFKLMFQREALYVPFIPINHSLPKANRIDALEPVVNSGRLLFNPHWRNKLPYALGMRQLFNYSPMSKEHDDGPDALAGLNELIQHREGTSQIVSWREANARQ